MEAYSHEVACRWAADVSGLWQQSTKEDWVWSARKPCSSATTMGSVSKGVRICGYARAGHQHQQEAKEEGKAGQVDKAVVQRRSEAGQAKQNRKRLVASNLGLEGQSVLRDTGKSQLRKVW